MSGDLRVDPAARPRVSTRSRSAGTGTTAQKNAASTSTSATNSHDWNDMDDAGDDSDDEHKTYMFHEEIFFDNDADAPVIFM